QWFADNGADLLARTGQHLLLTLTPLVIGLVLSIPLGWLANRYRTVYGPILAVSGLLYTIPSLALFIVMPLVLGTSILSPLNVIVALTIYTVALLVRTVADGLHSVPDDVLQAATAM